MSDIKKWMNIVENANITINIAVGDDGKVTASTDDTSPVPVVHTNYVPKDAPTIDVPAKAAPVQASQPKFNVNDTVTINSRVGGGVGRFVQYTKNGALIDIKGVQRELSPADFSVGERGFEDPYTKGNDWSHTSTETDSVGSMKDKPEFRPGDIVKVEDVYGSVIGPGYGIFVAYSTSGDECIISFDSKQIVVPIKNVIAVLEQSAKDNFDEMDNDGNLSPMSLGTQNLKIEESEMNHKDEFSKWVSAIEEALSADTGTAAPEVVSGSECGDCGDWNCPSCFPEKDSKGGLEVEMPLVDEESQKGKDIKLGDIVQKTEYRQTGGQNSPMTFGDDNLDEEMPGVGDEYAGHEDAANMIESIVNLQNMGFSKASATYSEDELANMSPEELKSCYDQVTGDVSEATGMSDPIDPPKPTKVKQKPAFDPNDMDDILSPRQDQPLTNYEPDDGEFNDTLPDPDMPAMPTASADATRRATSGIASSDEMRGWLNRINPLAGGDEPELEPTLPTTELVVRTARDVPAVISSAMRVAGVQTPDWHTINNLPGFQSRNIRGMGRQIFGMFTSTPLQDIKTVANVNGQGPNTDAEMRAVAGFLRDNAEDMGDVELDHGEAIPGYRPDVKEYRINGVRFHVVRDPMGQYIYAYPDADSRTNTGQGRIGNQQNPGDNMGQGILGNHNLPRLRESTSSKMSLFEELALDEEIKEAFAQLALDENELVDESTLSRLIGKQAGGQALVKWLHRKHKLSNEAELEPVKFNMELLWTQFKKNPDDFVIVSGTNGVAGIKPSEKHIKDMTKFKASKGQSYNPSGDSTMPYQIVAFTDNGEQVDPALLRAAPDADADEPAVRDPDPTVQRMRMGKTIGSDLLNPNNTMRLLQDQIGTFKTVWIAGWAGYRGPKNADSVRPSVGAVERDKIKARDELGVGPGRQQAQKPIPYTEAASKIFNRIRPILQPIVAKAYSKVSLALQDAVTADHQADQERLMAVRKVINEIKVAMNSSQEIRLSGTLSTIMTKALEKATDSEVNTPKFVNGVSDLAKGNSAALFPVVEALRKALIGAIR